MKAILKVAFATVVLAVYLMPKTVMADGFPVCDGRWMDPQWRDGNHDWRERAFRDYLERQRQQFEFAEQQRFAQEQAEAAQQARVLACNQATQNLANLQAQLAQATFMAQNNACGHNDACHANYWTIVAGFVAQVNNANADKQAKCAGL